MDPITVIIIFVLIFALLIVGGILFVKYFIEGLRETALENKSLDITIFEVKVPDDDETEIQAADQMFTGLLGIAKKYGGVKKYMNAKSFVSFEIVAFKDRIKFYVVCPSDVASTVDRQINGAYPMADISIMTLCLP